MKARFVYSFKDVEKKLLKKEKSLKANNKYSLKQAEAVIASVQGILDHPTTITLCCNDLEESNLYEFDEISIKPTSKGAPGKKLFVDIENQVVEAPTGAINNPIGLLQGIKEQYEEEPNPQESTNAKENIKKKPKFSLSLPFGGKKKTSRNIEVEEDYDEEIEEEPEEIEEEPEEVEEVEAPEEDPVEVSEEEPDMFGEDEDETATVPETSNQEIATVGNFNEVSVQPQQNFLPDSQANHSLVAMKKYETVSLPNYEEYMEIEKDINASVEEIKSKLTPENLFKFTHFSPVSISNTKLDQYRQSYIRKCLNEPKFELLREHYSKTVREVLGDGKDKLKVAYDRAALEDYELVAKKNLADELNKEQQEAENAYYEFAEEQQAVLREKEKKKREEQDAEIRAFVAQKEVELSSYISTEKDRVDNIVEDRKSVIYDELDKKCTKMIEDEWFNVKADYNRNLIDGKRVLVNTMLEEIQKANEDVWNVAQANIEEICNKVDDKMPVFAEDIEKFNALEKQQHEIDIDTKRITIEETKAIAEKVRAEQDLEKQRDLEHENRILKVKVESQKEKLEIMEMRQNNSDPQKAARPFAIPFFSR